MANKDYILLNGKPFMFTNRKCSEMVIGGSLERSISAKGHRDITTTKKRWSFSFDNVDEIFIYRLHTVFAMKSTITLVDYDGNSYTVFWISDFEPDEPVDGCFSILVDLEQQ